MPPGARFGQWSGQQVPMGNACHEKKVSRTKMNKREKNTDEQKRKEYKVVHVVAPVVASLLEGGRE